MSNTAIYVKTEIETKKEAQKVAKELGLSLSAVMNRLLKQFVKTKTLTFSAEDEIPNEHTLAIMKQAEKNYKEGNTSPKFDNSEDMKKWFDEQGI